MDFVGRKGSSVIFFSENHYAIIDESSNLVLSSGKVSDIRSLSLSSYEETHADFVKSTTRELALGAITSLNIEVLSTSDRMHTIPKAVVAEAKRGLAWRAEEDRGGTSVGLNTARTLAEGGQIGIKKIRHIAKYFPRHEVDKKGKGWKPGEEGYPSNGRIAWALWGGDAARRWASAIVEREDKKLAEASMLAAATNQSGISVFSVDGVSFAVRMRRDSKVIDRLYQISPNGTVFVWDDGEWDDLGNIANDFDTYDKSLDDPYDREERVHIPIDAKSALVVAGILDSKPFDGAHPSDISYNECAMVISSMSSLDWASMQAISAAGEPNQDGNYTPEERSAKAKKQFRDRTGKFGKVGGRVQVGLDPNTRGVLESVDPKTGIATVKLDDGSTVQSPVADTEPEKTMPTPSGDSKLDTSGILGETKERKNRFKARLPKKLDILSPEDLKGFLADYPDYVEKQRANKGITAAGTESSREGEFKNPAQSDIAPIYMAVVAQDDPQAVMEVIALIPASAQSNTPMVFRRAEGKWQKADDILADLNSPTPPPVVVLDMKTLEDVLKQVDSAVTASAFGQRNAEVLRNYWLHGEGAEKIQWKSPGGWTRCVANLSKYMEEDAASYCAFLHKAATGVWAGDSNSREVYGLAASGVTVYSDDLLISEDQYLSEVITAARVEDARSRVLTASGPIEDVQEGSRFFIPLVIPEGVESGDGRIFDKDAIDIRELPLPLLWQIKSGEGHNGSVVVGRIDSMEKTEDGIGNAHGVFDTGTYGREAERLVRGGFIRGVSADLDKFEASEETTASENSEEGEISTGRIKISKARVMAVTLVPKPAFQECTIEIEEEQQEEEVVPDGIYVEGMDPTEASSIVACGIIAGAIPVVPPTSWFEDPKLDKATPLTVTDDGQVFGHIAAWHVDHIGMAFGTKPPRSRSKYAYFHTGIVRTENGTDVPVGQLTLAGGHASLEMSAQQAVRHYDDTASAVADVHAGEDAYGIWVAGALRPGTTPEQIRALRASAPSGDWRPIKGHLELVAVCQVNVPGFPIARARVASGQVMALVAAGANMLAHMKSDPVAELNARIDRLERQPLEMAAEDARRRVLAAKAEELAAKMKKAKSEIVQDDISWMTQTFEDGDTESEAAVISADTRKKLAQEGKALPDGSYPIRNVSDLKNAVKAFGRAKPSERTKVRKHIVKRARGLGREDLIPENWPEAPKKSEASIDSIPAEGLLAAGDGPCWEGYEMVGWKEKDGKKVPNCVPVDASVENDPAIAHFKQFSPEEREALAKKGLALPDGSFPIENDRDLKNAIWAYGRAVPSKRDEVKAHIIKRAKALGKEDMLPEVWAGEGSSFSDEDDDELTFSIRERLAIAQSVVAAGGLDRNRGNAERLRRYWTHGEGAAKIRWGTPGDWKRCVRHLAKYLGPRAKGYCQLRHKEATGVYTGSRFNPGRNNSAQEFGLSEALSDFQGPVETVVTENDMLTPIEWIMQEDDGLFDSSWEPDHDVVIMLVDFDSDIDSEDDMMDDTMEYGDDDFDSVFAAEDGDALPKDLTPEEIEALKMERLDRARKLKIQRKGRYIPGKTQPRDATGRFRKVLARLKLDLGAAGLDKAIKKVEEIENLDFSGDYNRAAKASQDLIGIIDRLDTKALNPESIENVRASSAELGKVIANLPFAFGEQAEKIRFSDVPPALRDLMEDMIKRVEAKIGKKDADIATADLRSFMSGQDYYSQSDISSQMSKLLRLLT